MQNITTCLLLHSLHVCKTTDGALRIRCSQYSFFVALSTVFFTFLAPVTGRQTTIVHMWVTQTSDSSGFLLRAFTFIYYSQILQICTVYMVLSSASIRTPDQRSVYHSRMLSKKIEMHALIFSIITTVRRHSEKQAIHISYSLLLRYFKRQQQLQ